MKIKKLFFPLILLLIILAGLGLYLYREKIPKDFVDSITDEKIYKLESKDFIGRWSWDQSPEIIFEINEITGERTIEIYLHCRFDSRGNWELNDDGTLIITKTDYEAVYIYTDVKMVNSRITAVNEDGEQVYFTRFVKDSHVVDNCP